MIPPRSLDKPMWRTAIHHALSGNVTAINLGWIFNRASLKPFLFVDIKEILGAAEVARTREYWDGVKREYIKIIHDDYSAVVLLKDGRYCYFTANRNSKTGLWNSGRAIYCKDLRALIRDLESADVETLKLQYFL